MRFSKAPKKSDSNLSFDTYYATYNNVKRLLNIKFDPSVFYTIESPDGIYVTARPTVTTTTTTTTKKPFGLASVGTGDAGSSSSSNAQAGFYLDNNRGKWICRILGIQYEVTEGDNVEYDPSSLQWFCSPTPAFDFDESADVAYVYLKFDRKNLTISLNANSFFPEIRDNVDDKKYQIEYRLLWIYSDPSFTGTFNIDYFIDACEGYCISGMV